MFHFFNEINDLLQVPVTNVLNGYEYINLSGKAIYIQGYKDILSFNEEHIILKLKKGELHIKGENLNIRDLNLNCILIEGRIFIVEEAGVK